MQSQKDAANRSNRVLRVPQVLERVPFRRTTLYQEVRAGRFPQPLKLTPKAIGWLEVEVDAWIAARAAERAAPQAAQS